MPRQPTTGRPIKPTPIKGRNFRVVPRPRKDGSYGYQAQVYNPATRKREVVDTYDAPEEAVAACQRRLGLLADGPSITVAAVQRRWLDWKHSEGHMLASVRRAQESTDPFVAVYGNEPINTISRPIARDWINQHRSHYGDLQAMANWAVRHLDALPGSPFAGMRPAARSKINPDLARRALTETELLALAEHARRRHGLWHYVLVLWIGFGGQRIAEALDTTVDAIEGTTANGNLRVRVETQWRDEEKRSRHVKQKKGGSIIIPGWVADAAKPLIEAAREHPDGLIFVTPKGQRFTTQNYRVGYWYQAREGWTATLPETHWLRRRLAADPRLGLESHELRHTSSTIIQTRTHDLNASRAQLRHSKQAMTINYTHPEDELGLAAVDAAYTAPVIPLRREVS
jgi:hypothetical protein